MDRDAHCWRASRQRWMISLVGALHVARRTSEVLRLSNRERPPGIHARAVGRSDAGVHDADRPHLAARTRPRDSHLSDSRHRLRADRSRRRGDRGAVAKRRICVCAFVPAPEHGAPLDRRSGAFPVPEAQIEVPADGTFIEGRATRAMDRFSVRRDGATVVVDLDALHKQDADPAGWSAAFVHLS
jgi:hypothetical protein